MNAYLNAGDWVVIVAYLGGIIGLGVWFGHDQRNTRDYFLGSRNMPWWGIGLSIVAAETSALTVIGVPAKVSGSPMELASPDSTGTAALSPDLTVIAASVVVIWSAFRSPDTADTATVPVAVPLPSLTV